MTEDEAGGMVSYLEDKYGKAYPLRTCELLIQDLLPFSKADGQAAVKLILEKEPQYFPTPPTVLKYIKEIGTQQREKQNYQERLENQQHREIIPQPSGEMRDVIKKGLQLTRATLDGLITREQTLEGMMHLSNMAPRAGWATAAAHLREFYKQNPLPEKKQKINLFK